MTSKIERQIALEEEGVEIGVKKYKALLTKEDLADMGVGISLMHTTIKRMSAAIREFMADSRGSGRLYDVKQFLNQFEPEVIAYIASKRCINALSGREPIQRVAIQTASMLKDHLEYTTFKEAAPAYLYRVEENLRTRNATHRRTVIMRAKRMFGIEDEAWSERDRLHIGVKLIELFIESTGLITKAKQYGRQTLLQATPEAEAWLEDSHARCELLDPLYMPMIVKPKAWDTVYGGGFLTNDATLSLKLVKTAQYEVLQELAHVDMPEVYNAINAVQDTAWRINKKIHDVVRSVWEEGTGLGCLPSPDEEELPLKPWDTDEEYAVLKETDPDAVKGWKRAATRVYASRVKAASRRISLMQKLWVADKFKDEDEIYFVWTMDWRGRMYPVQSFINPQADDTGKALIEFAEGKPLGKDGAYWLAVHIANEYGYDKASFDERVAWVGEHAEQILDSANNPLDGLRFWSEADYPYRFLAACMEWAGYKKEGDAHVSRIPVGLDGSCNGLQNFSAMLRDEVGGAAVNLVPQERPADVYTEVATVVSSMVTADAAAGDENALVWLNKVDRGIAKRNVMTLPYGAKKYGFKGQLMQELAKRDKGAATYLKVEDNFAPCVYLADRMYEGIGKVVVAARKAMDWLQESAKIASNEDVPLRWNTPTGFLVIQKYRKQKLQRISTFWGGIRTSMGLVESTDKLDKVKQANGIAPNYVHSLDASHLSKTVNLCKENGINSFAMIHDSYGTHACDVSTLARTLRVAFVDLYTDDVLAIFKDTLEGQLGGIVLPDLPAKGTLDLNKVLDAEYFFA